MRKLTAVLMVLVFALMALPVAAQEDSNTIADIVIASATADEPEFATLLAAVQAADPAVVEALSNPEAELTVFAPTDAAFAALAEALGEEAFNGVLADTEALTGILLFHVLDGIVGSGDVVAALEENDGAFSVPSLNGQYIDIAGNVEDGITVDGANLILELVDIEASNGVIHVIDAVILPESRTMAEIVVELATAEEPEFSTLLAAVQAADPAVLETLSDTEAELTVFAPTDAAFAALAEALGEEAFNGVLADTETLTNILLYHVVPAVVYSGDLGDLLAGEDMDMEGEEEGEGEEGEEEMMEMMPVEVETASGAIVTFTATEDGVFINDAQIIMTDIDAANGVIHVIDAVILPPQE